MIRFKDISIRHKIISIVMLISFLILGITSVIYSAVENHRIKSDVKEESELLLSIATKNFREFLLHGQHEKMDETFDIFCNSQYVAGAFVFNNSQILLTSYNPEKINYGESLSEQSVKKVNTYYSLIEQNIYHDNSVIGKVALIVDYNFAKAQYNLLVKIIFGVVLLLLVVVYFLARLFQRSISVPIFQLTEVTEKLSSKVNYSVRLKNDRKDEIGRLNKSFNNMLKNLEKREKDNVKSAQRLKEAKELAEKADNLKSAFLANMSHEIRTPMNSIIGFADLLAENSEDDDENKAYIQLIKTSSIRLLHLIDDILDISKMEAGQLKIVKTEFELISLLQEIYVSFSEENKTENMANVELNLVIPENIDSLWIKTDEIRLRQIISNLLSNAVKFTSKGNINLGFELFKDVQQVRKHMIRFFVKDTGAGMSINTQKIIFDRFTKVEPDNTKYHHGTGLGLTICKKLVEYLDGQISVKSQPGKGSEFRFTIPHIRVSHKEEKPTISLFNTKQTEVSSLDEKNILIVEDEKSNFELIKMILRNSGARIQWAKNGQEALKYCEDIDFDLVLMDIKMPVMNGYDTVDKLRKRGFKMPVIAQTAYALPEDVREIQSHEFDAYLPKPIVRKKLMKTIEKLIH